MIRAPHNFDGTQFAKFYGLSTGPVTGDFWIDANGFFHCPSVPDLTEDDLARFISPEPPATMEQEIDALKLIVGMLMEGDDDV